MDEDEGNRCLEFLETVQRIAWFSKRNISRASWGLKAAVGMLIISSTTYIIGFVSPYWIEEGGRQSRDNVSGSRMPSSDFIHTGVWEECTIHTGQRSCTIFKRNIDSVVVMLGCVGSGLQVSVCIWTLLSCLRRPSRSRGVFTVVGAVFGGVFGLTCVILFVVVHGTRSYSWALALDVAGSVLTLVAAIIVLWSLRRLKSTATVGSHKITVGRTVSLVAIKDTSVHVPPPSPPASSPPSSASPTSMDDPGVQGFPEDGQQASFIPVASGQNQSMTGPIVRLKDGQVRSYNPGKDVTSLLRLEPCRTVHVTNSYVSETSRKGPMEQKDRSPAVTSPIQTAQQTNVRRFARVGDATAVTQSIMASCAGLSLTHPKASPVFSHTHRLHHHTARQGTPQKSTLSPKPRRGHQLRHTGSHRLRETSPAGETHSTTYRPQSYFSPVQTLFSFKPPTTVKKLTSDDFPL